MLLTLGRRHQHIGPEEVAVLGTCLGDVSEGFGHLLDDQGAKLCQGKPDRHGQEAPAVNRLSCVWNDDDNDGS